MNNKTTTNLIYALAIFFYIDLSVGVAIWIGSEYKEKVEIEKVAEDILNTPDLVRSI